MIPGNVDPRRPDKVQRYKPANSGSSNTSGEDLTPDYMNILGPESTTGNVQGDICSENVKSSAAKSQPSQQQTAKANEAPAKPSKDTISAVSNPSNVIPTSPQYGLAIIPTTSNDISSEVITLATDSIIESTAKTTDSEIKDMHSTPSKNDRFKVVKIASTEPFRRGRWKCMDYVDQAPSATSLQQTKTSQGTTTVPMAGNVYMQTQSLPPQQIQQLLMQGAFTTTQPQFYQSNIQSQIVPQAQYFYPPVQNQPTTQQPILSTTTVQPQFQQQYFQPNVIPTNYQNVQFAQAASYPNQNSAFVPTTQNFPTQQIPATQPQPQPMVNGFAYTPQPATEQIPATNLPTQVAKNVILTNSSQPSQPESQSRPPPESYQPGTEPYPNPQFTPLSSTELTDAAQIVTADGTEPLTESGNPDDPAKTNPVVNAIDNKIEQAMDLVKSHLMYTVREEVEVLKEKIAELMERIQQLESENNFLRSQIPKSNPNSGPSEPSPQP